MCTCQVAGKETAARQITSRSEVDTAAQPENTSSKSLSLQGRFSAVRNKKEIWNYRTFLATTHIRAVLHDVETWVP